MTNLKCINFYKKTLAPLQMLTVVLNNFILKLPRKEEFFIPPDIPMQEAGREDKLNDFLALLKYFYNQ